MDHGSDQKSRTCWQIKHDIGSDLSVINMGLDALPGVREDEQQFREIVSMMQSNVASLKEKVAALVEIASPSSNGDH